MKLTGVKQFNRSANVIWDALHSTDYLKHAIPGCKEIVRTEEGEYAVHLKLGVAAVKGDYEGKVKIEDIEENAHYVLIAEGSGKPGFVSARMDCKLVDNGEQCELAWDYEAEIGGMIAGVGSRVISGIAKFMANNFFKEMEKQIEKKMSV